MSKTTVRINRELKKLGDEPLDGVEIEVNEKNIRYLNIKLRGPGDTPYDNGIFKMEMFLPSEYPLVPPKIRFLTKIYHPNIDGLGRICLDVLKDKWTPALQIRTIMLSIQALLSSPNLDDPLDETVATHFKENLKDARNKALRWTKEYAQDES